MILRCVILGVLVGALGAQAEVRRPASDQTRELMRKVRQLQYRLDAVADGQERVRYLQGGVFLASVGYLYGVYLAQEEFTTGAVNKVAKGVVGTTGIIFGAAGALTLLFPGAAESAGIQFRAIPGRNLAQLQSKLDRGEALLRKLAHRARFSNNLIGGGFLAVGIADLVWFLGTGPNNDLNFLAYLGGLYSALGLALILIETPAEQEWDEYRQEKTAARAPTGTSLAVVPQLGGASLGLRLTF